MTFGLIFVFFFFWFNKQMYDRISRVEHVDHARGSAQHCVKALLTAQTHNYDYLPYFYSRVFEYEGSSRKVWWQFFGDNGNNLCDKFILSYELKFRIKFCTLVEQLEKQFKLGISIQKLLHFGWILVIFSPLFILPTTISEK